MGTSTNDSATLDLFFRGDRDYIQGSLILSECVEWYLSRQASEPIATVSAATFSSIVTRPCTVRVWEKGLQKETLFRARIDLTSKAGNKVSLAVLETDRKALAPRHPDSGSRLTEFTNEGKLGCVARYVNGGSLETFLQALIETNKRCHSETYASAKNIWFLSLFDVNLPVEDDYYSETGRIVVEHEAERPSRGRMTSVNHVTVDLSSGPTLELRLLFGYEI